MQWLHVQREAKMHVLHVKRERNWNELTCPDPDYFMMLHKDKYGLTERNALHEK